MTGSRPLFRKLGGQYQLTLDDADALTHLAALDEGLWIATSVPADSLRADPELLACLDADKNGRIRTDEVRSAAAWLLRHLSDRSGITAGEGALRLDALDISHESGKALRAAAEQILRNLGESGDRLTLAQVRNQKRILAHGDANGDGVIPPEAIREEDLAAFARAVMETAGGAPDASGLTGVDRAALDRFLKEARAFLDWTAQGLPESEEERARLRPLGDATPSAFAAMTAVAGKVDNYFALCGLCRIDPKVSLRAWGEETAAETAFADTSAVEERLRQAPLARPSASAALPLGDKVNPAWRGALHALRADALDPLGIDVASGLTQEAWQELCRKLEPYGAWYMAKPATKAEGLGVDRLGELLDSDLPERLSNKIETDQAAADDLTRVDDLEKLILLQRDFLTFCNNFVNLRDLYAPDRRSLLEMGTLVLDGRRFRLCVRVRDRATHKRIAAGSHMCLLYVEVAGKTPEASFELAVAVTAGRTTNLWPGRQALFVTPGGEVYDARILEMVENPTGLWEAIQRPFRQLGEFLGKQAERFTTSRYTDLETRLDKGIKETEKTFQSGLAAPDAAKAQETTAAAPSSLRDLLMGGGVAVAALGGAFAVVTQTLASFDLQTVLWVLGLLVLMVVLPTLAVAAVKLRRRNLGVLLAACGWAVNGDLYLTHLLGNLFTRRPAEPEGSRHERTDLAAAFARHLPQITSGRLAAAAVLLLTGLILLAIFLPTARWYWIVWFGT